MLWLFSFCYIFYLTFTNYLICTQQDCTVWFQWNPQNLPPVNSTKCSVVDYTDNEQVEACCKFNLIVLFWYFDIL